MGEIKRNRFDFHAVKYFCTYPYKALPQSAAERHGGEDMRNTCCFIFIYHCPKQHCISRVFILHHWCDRLYRIPHLQWSTVHLENNTSVFSSQNEGLGSCIMNSGLVHPSGLINHHYILQIRKPSYTAWGVRRVSCHISCFCDWYSQWMILLECDEDSNDGSPFIIMTKSWNYDIKFHFKKSEGKK